MSSNKTLRLKDYKRPDFTTDHVDLDIDIHDDGAVTVTSEVTYYQNEKRPRINYGNSGKKRKNKQQNTPTLILDAVNPNKNKKFLKSLSINGKPLEKVVYSKKGGKIILPVTSAEKEVTVKAVTHLEPDANSRLLGLYQSDQCYVTQCESEGFRSITPFLDRPDVMATYNVTVHADDKEFPVLLANGNKINAGQEKDGRHYATYEDPLPKPSYLFALASGKFDFIEDKHVTPSGHEVNLRIYTEPGKEDRAQHAMWALKRAMEFDEKVFDREYELDNFSIVAVSKFTYGAMENTSLNVFRDSLVLASPDIATDSNYDNITRVVGHEYFHHWSGNQVTLQNWFNLSLKEGLTVLRDQLFTASLTSEDWSRIRDISILKNYQFTQDDGPMAMPVLPSELQALHNIYNGTTYRKGAEVLRMMKTFMGDEKFYNGVKDYFDTYKSQSVSIDHFIDKMEKASGMDLSNKFKLWYTQAGRPRVKATVAKEWDNDSKTYAVTLEQTVPPTKGQDKKDLPLMPVKMALVDKDGNDLPLKLSTDTIDTPDTGDTERVFEFFGEETKILDITLSSNKKTFVFTDLEKPPAFHSLFRDLSAPVTFDSGLSKEQLQLQARVDSNAFSRWDAMQRLALDEMVRHYESYNETGEVPDVDEQLLDLYRDILADTNTHPALTAQMMSMPTYAEFEKAVAPANPGAISAVRKNLRETLGRELYEDFKAVFDKNNDTGVYSSDYDSMGQRSLKAVAVRYMLSNGGDHNLKTAQHLYENANNMTDRMIYMGAVNNHPGPHRDAVMNDFYENAKDDSLVIQKWFVMQGKMKSNEIFKSLDSITESDVFNWENPGHAQSLFGGLIGNYEQFHREDGKGYEYLADMIVKLDKINSATASRFVGALGKWQDYEGQNSQKMVEQLERLAAMDDLSVDVREIVEKSLPNYEFASLDEEADKNNDEPRSNPPAASASP